jgi:hypothetical protein
MAVAINTVGRPFNDDGSVADEGAAVQMSILMKQVVDFAHMRGNQRM